MRKYKSVASNPFLTSKKSMKYHLRNQKSSGINNNRGSKKKKDRNILSSDGVNFPSSSPFICFLDIYHFENLLYNSWSIDMLITSVSFLTFLQNLESLNQCFVLQHL